MSDTSLKELIVYCYDLMPAVMWQILLMVLCSIIMRNFAFQRRISYVLIMAFLCVVYMCAFGFDERTQEWIILQNPVIMRLGPGERYPMVSEKVSGEVRVLQKQKNPVRSSSKKEEEWFKIDAHDMQGWIRL